MPVDKRLSIDELISALRHTAIDFTWAGRNITGAWLSDHHSGSYSDVFWLS